MRMESSALDTPPSGSLEAELRQPGTERPRNPSAASPRSEYLLNLRLLGAFGIAILFVVILRLFWLHLCGGRSSIARGVNRVLNAVGLWVCGRCRHLHLLHALRNKHGDKHHSRAYQSLPDRHLCSDLLLRDGVGEQLCILA
eukprot:XP_001707340.1 Hypothetical protein GL50803_19855 [Giardia lamblia ATCC 50803]